MMKKIFAAILLTSLMMLYGRDFTISFNSNDIQWNLFQAYNTTEAQIFTGIYEGLVSYNPATNKPVPAAAESWTLSEDRLSYTFVLRKNLQYSNGDPIKAEHFRKSWLKSLDPVSGSRFASLLDVIEGASAYNRGEISADDVAIHVLSDYEIKVDLVEPAPQFLSILCHYSFALAHPVMVNLEDWNSMIHIPCSGPYRISSRKAEEVVLEKNPYYWDSKNVKLDRIILRFNLSTQVTMNRFNDYDIDWVFNGIDTNLLEDGNRLVVSPSFATSYYFFSNRSVPWNDERIRKALSLLLPWSTLKEQFLIPGDTLVPPIPQYPELGGINPQDHSKAMELLQQAGYPQGEGLPEIVIRVDSSQWGDPIPLQMKQIWESELKTTVSIDTLPAYYYYDSLSRDDYSLAYLSWVGDYADPMTFLQMWKSDSSFNDAGYSNPEFDRLLAEAALKEPGERYKILSEAEMLLLDSAEVMPTQHLPSIHLIDLRMVDGWFSNALDIHPLKSINWREGYIIPGLAETKKDPAYLAVLYLTK